MGLAVGLAGNGGSSGGGGAVASVFTRTGAVVAASGDYTAAQVTNAADKASAAVQVFTGHVTSTEFNGTYFGSGDGFGNAGQYLDFSAAGSVNFNNVDVRLLDAGKGIRVKEGSNCKQGTATLVAGAVTVANTAVTANSRIFLTVQSLGTILLPAAVGVTARTPGTDFTIKSSDITDTSVVAYQIFEPA